MKTDDEHFLRRWSRLKQTQETDSLTPTGSEQAPEPEQAIDAQAQPTSTDLEQQDLPLWQQPDADPSEKREALRALFRKPKFNVTDGLDEYDNDYNYHAFASLGSVVTQEMNRMLKLAEQSTTDTVEIQPPVAQLNASSKDECDPQEDTPVA